MNAGKAQCLTLDYIFLLFFSLSLTTFSLPPSRPPSLPPSLCNNNNNNCYYTLSDFVLQIFLRCTVYAPVSFTVHLVLSALTVRFFFVMIRSGLNVDKLYNDGLVFHVRRYLDSHKKSVICMISIAKIYHHHANEDHQLSRVLQCTPLRYNLLERGVNHLERTMKTAESLHYYPAKLVRHSLVPMCAF